MNAAARQLIAQLQLEPLAREGGFFRVTRRTASMSAIFYLLTDDDFSAVHRIAQDEIWHFHAGDCVEHLQINEQDGRLVSTRLGANVARGEIPQVFVAAGAWQAARLARHAAAETRHGYALLGCTVSPPFEEGGFELLSRAEASRRFPAHADLLLPLTR